MDFSSFNRNGEPQAGDQSTNDPVLDLLVAISGYNPDDPQPDNSDHIRSLLHEVNNVSQAPEFPESSLGTAGALEANNFTGFNALQPQENFYGATMGLPPTNHSSFLDDSFISDFQNVPNPFQDPFQLSNSSRDDPQQVLENHGPIMWRSAPLNDSLFTRTFEAEPTNATIQRKRPLEVEKESVVENRGNIQRGISRSVVGEGEADVFESGDNEDYGPRSNASPTAAGEMSDRSTTIDGKKKANKPNKGKRGSRPSMGAMFNNLEVGPDDYVLLSKAAKKYMLDVHHPERRECVARSKGIKYDETEMIRLKMYSCAIAFLDQGWGDRLWGKSGPRVNDPNTKMKWPEEKNTVIQRITPLLRRMVTNARQSEYEKEKRMNKCKQKWKLPDDSAFSDAESTQRPRSQNAMSPEAGHAPSFDLGHPRNTRDVDQQNITNGGRDMGQSGSGSNSGASNGQAPAHSPTDFTTDDLHVQYHVNILNGPERVSQKFVLTTHDCSGYSSLVERVNIFINDMELVIQKIRIHGPDGLVEVKNEGDFTRMVNVISGCEWMDGQVRCLVQVDRI